MFDSIGWGEVVVLGLAALFIFGPDRLPSLAKDAADGLKKLREVVTGARMQLHDGLGEDFDHLKDLDLRRYRPATFLREQLTGDGTSPSTDHRRTQQSVDVTTEQGSEPSARTVHPTPPSDGEA